MSTEQMRKLMEASAVLDGQPVEENIITESICTEYQVDEISEQTVNIMATTNVPALYMTEGDILCLESTDGNYLYSETNGMKYERSFISGLENRGMIEIIREDAPVEEGIEEDIFGNPADKKSAIIKYAGRKAEDAIRIAQLGIELDGKHAKLFKDIRAELVELKVWLRERK